jgi:hypothetical protein
MIELRVRTKISADELEMKKGKQLQNDDVNAYLVGPARVLQPDGKLLCVYLPGAITPELREATYPILHKLKDSYTSNRGLASGSERVKGASQRTYAKTVDSAIVGSFDAKGPKQYCRLTAWTGRETEAFQGLWPLLQFIAGEFAANVPERYAVQAREAARTSPEWVIPGTPFTTVTVNNTYATGVHTDSGDLENGFSTLAVFRQGDYKGGCLVFPEYRLGVDMQDGDLLLMDAHAWHGNTRFDPDPERIPTGRLAHDPGFERISVVSYFRTNMVDCGSAATEADRARQYSENRNAALLGE